MFITANAVDRMTAPAQRSTASDASEQTIDIAQKRAPVAGLCYRTRFVTADPNTCILHERYNVVVVRRALLLQSELAILLRYTPWSAPTA